MLFEAAFAAMVMKEHASLISGFQGASVLRIEKSSAAMARRPHPAPSRTRKLSSAAATIGDPRIPENSALPSSFLLWGPSAPFFVSPGVYFLL